MADVKLTWFDVNYGEDGHNVYRSGTPMDPNNLPAPLATLGPGVEEYTDTTVVDNNTYYYRASAVFGANEYVTPELEVVVGSLVFFFDTYPVAAAAYSVRRLSGSYTGSALRVRRSSDNTQQDIGFDGLDLDTTALLAFAGVGDAQVVTWYDQTGNANHITFAPNVGQPKIVEAGALLTDGSRPALFAQSGAGVGPGGWSTGVGAGWTQKTVFVVADADRLDGANANPSRIASGYSGGGSVGNGFLMDRVTVDDVRVFDGGASLTISNQATERSLFNCYRTSNVLGASVNNGADVTTGVGTNANPYNIHLYEDVGGTLYAEVPRNLQEVILYDTDQTANRAGMKDSINTYFNLWV